MKLSLAHLAFPCIFAVKKKLTARHKGQFHTVPSIADGDKRRYNNGLPLPVAPL